MSARLLLIEDDVSITRFVALALEELPDFAPTAPAVELSVVSRLSDARTALQQGGWQLVISDLMLPDGSAEMLLAEGWPRAPAAPPWIIFSAGLHEARSLDLDGHGVARTLRKPASLTELLTAVAELLAPGPVAGASPAVDTETDAVTTHFGGDRDLYENFRCNCIAQFSHDLAAGDAALADGDAPALRRVAHGLKAVLELIGHADLAARARALEQGAADCAPGQPLPPGWPAVADGLIALGARRRG